MIKNLSFKSTPIDFCTDIRFLLCALTCIIPCLISTSNNLYSVSSEGTGVGTLVWSPKTLARLANTGSVAKASASL